MASALDKILNLIRKPKAGAAEYRAALAELDPKAAEAAVDALEVRRQALLLKGDATALDAIEAEIKTGNREVERLHAAVKELSRLLNEAEAAERAAEADALERGIQVAAQELRRLIRAKDASGIEAQVAELRRGIEAAEAFGLGPQIEARGQLLFGVQACVMHRYLALDAAAATVCELLDGISSDTTHINQENRFFHEQDLGHLQVLHPTYLLADHLNIDIRGGRRFPIDINEWKLPGYGPRGVNVLGGRLLGAMADIIEKHHVKAG